MFAPFKDPNHPYYNDKALLLEPFAILPLQYGTFTYTGAVAARKYVLASWATQFGGIGRFEIRDPNKPFPIFGQNLVGTGANSIACLIDPAATSYSDALKTFYDRSVTIAGSVTRFIGAGDGDFISTPFLPGPYGTIVTSVTVFDYDWCILGIRNNATGFNLYNEQGDKSVTATSSNNRYSTTMSMPVVKGYADTFLTGMQRTTNSGEEGQAMITMIDCPSTWANTGLYDAIGNQTCVFRDDFMSASFNSGSKWTTINTGGSSAYVSNRPWLNIIGDNTWGHNSCYSVTTVARSAQPRFICDFLLDSGRSIAVGFSTGAGQSYTDLAHGLVISSNDTSGDITIFENSTSRGSASSSNILPNTTYRVRIRALSGGGATNRIQGGGFAEQIGSSSWVNLWSGTTNSASNTLRAGLVVNSTGNHYFSDVRVY